MDADLVYYRRRSSAERAAAAAAHDRKVRAIHLELAKHYEERIAVLEAERRRAEMHLVSAA
jgi:thymidylate kinase